MIGNGWDEKIFCDGNLEILMKPYNEMIKLSKENDICPSLDNVFNAFKLTTYDNTKVVIIGQDPYHTDEIANGLAFSVNKCDKIPPSLKNIFKEIECEFDLPKNTFSHGDLTKWATQGVLLLNATLSVERGKPNSHSKIGWADFTSLVIEKLNQKEEPIVFILWGKFAEKKCNIIDDRHYVLTSAHPSPLSARRGFFGCNHFKLANDFLTKSNLTPIDWVT